MKPAEKRTISLLVADIGGTNARFALATAHDGVVTMGPVSVFLTAEYERLELALERFLDQSGRPALSGVAACAAGPVQGSGPRTHIPMTNCPWDVAMATFTRATGVDNTHLMNDFSALALSIPALTGGDLHPVGTARKGIQDAPVGVLGAGTGLGVSALVFGDGHEIALAGEGGHVDLAPANAKEAAILAHLQSLYGHVSVERVLSGPGLVALYEVLAAISGGEKTPAPSPAEIATRARAGTCAISVEVVRLFCGWLGAVAGDLALTLGARGGIYIGGGIVPGWIAGGPGLFDENLFRTRFEAKGRFETYLSQIPVFVIRRADAALLGLARAALRETA